MLEDSHGDNDIQEPNATSDKTDSDANEDTTTSRNNAFHNEYSKKKGVFGSSTLYNNKIVRIAEAGVQDLMNEQEGSLRLSSSLFDADMERLNRIYNFNGMNSTNSEKKKERLPCFLIPASSCGPSPAGGSPSIAFYHTNCIILAALCAV